VRVLLSGIRATGGQAPWPGRRPGRSGKPLAWQCVLDVGLYYAHDKKVSGYHGVGLPFEYQVEHVDLTRSEQLGMYLSSFEKCRELSGGKVSPY
jgi:hypothetical protein